MKLWIAVLLAVLASAAHAQPAQRIISLAPHLTELAFAAGAGDRIIATVEYSDYPAAAREIPRIGNAFRVDLERVLALRPDAVIVWDSGTPPQTVERLRALNLRVVSFKTFRLDDVATTVRELGQLAGTSATAAAAATQFESGIRKLREQYRDRAPVRVFLQVYNRPLYTVNGKQIMSEVVELCGGRNVFAQLNDLAPAVGVEAVIAANPQVIISTDDMPPSADEVWRPWQHIEAVRAGNVFTLHSDEIARATTRLVASAGTVCRTLDTARERLRAR